MKKRIRLGLLVLFMYIAAILLLSSCGSSKTYDADRRHYGNSCVK